MCDRMWRVLSVKPHWAWAIVHGPKQIENRTWDTPYRGIVLIHASSRRPPRSVRSLVPGMPDVDELDIGAIIGAVRLTGIVPYAAVKGYPFAEGPKCWKFSDPIALPKYRVPGKLNLFRLQLPASVDCNYRELIGSGA